MKSKEEEQSLFMQNSLNQYNFKFHVLQYTTYKT